MGLYIYFQHKPSLMGNLDRLRILVDSLVELHTFPIGKYRLLDRQQLYIQRLLHMVTVRKEQDVCLEFSLNENTLV